MQFEFISNRDGKVVFHCDGNKQTPCSVTGINC